MRGEQDMSNEIPLYQNMINDLIHQIEGGKLQQDAKLPSEADLGDSYSVSRITVRRALAELVDRGYIYKRHGIGSFVARKSIPKTNAIPGMINLEKVIRSMDAQPRIELKDFRLIVNGSEPVVRSNLGLNSDDYLYVIDYQIFADDDLVGLVHWYLPYAQFPNLYLSELERHQLLPLLVSKYEFKPEFQTHRSSDLATRAEKHLFGSVPGNVMVHLRLTGTVQGKSLIYGEITLTGQVTMYLY